MFDINQSIFDPETGESDEDLVIDYVDEIVSLFCESPEAKPHLEQFGQCGYIEMFLEYAFDYLGESLPNLTEADVREILFEIFPRKVSTEPETAGAIVAELRAFFAFLARAYQLPNAKKIGAILKVAAESRLRRELANPANYGMAKSIFMQGKEAGFDMMTEEGAHAFIEAYNQRILSTRVPVDLPPNPFAALSDREILGIVGGFDPPDPRKLHAQKDKIRKARKAQRQARKKNRR